MLTANQLWNCMTNLVFHGRRKHIDMRYHFIHEPVENDNIVQHVGTAEQWADILTKSMAIVKFEETRSLLRVKNISVLELGGKMLV